MINILFLLIIFLVSSCNEATGVSGNQDCDMVSDIDFSETIDEDVETMPDETGVEIIDEDVETMPDETGVEIYNGEFIVKKLWTKQWGSRLEDGPVSIVDIKDDRIYLESSTYGKIGDINYYGGDPLIQILNKYGSILDLRQWGTNSLDTLGGYFVEEDGTIFSAGITRGEFDGYTNAGSLNGKACEQCQDLYVTKWNSEGVLEKTVQFGTSEDDRTYKIIKSANSEGFLVYGDSDGEFEGTTQIGSYDITLFVFDNYLSLKKTYVFGSERNDIADDIFYDSDGYLYISGHTQGNIAKETDEAHSFSYYMDNFLIKLDKDLNIVWKKQYFIKDLDQEYHNWKIDKDGQMYSMGMCSEKSDESTEYGYFLRKIDSKGNEIFFKKWIFESMTEMVDFDFFKDFIIFAGSDNGEIYLAAIDMEGNSVFKYMWGSGDGEDTDSIFIDGNDIFVTGTTQGNLDGNTNLTGYKPDYEDNSADFFMTKFHIE